jgi:hypothetical protein
MPDPADDKIRALVVELAEHAPVAPPFDEIETRPMPSPDRSRRRRPLAATAVAAGLALVAGAVVLLQRDEQPDRVRTGPPTTTTVAAGGLRLTAEFLPPGFAAQPGEGPLAIQIFVPTGGQPEMKFTAPTEGTLSENVVQATSFVRGTPDQPDVGLIFLIISKPEISVPELPSGEPRQLGDRSVVVTRTEVSGRPAFTASWREAGHRVSVYASGITEPQLDAFVRGLRPS